jgi:enolase-phosphatase E1
MIRAIVTDIEGTTSSLSFVKDVLFPYARQRIGAFVREHAMQPDVRAQLAVSETVGRTLTRGNRPVVRSTRTRKLHSGCRA